jgi:hypothetical protein
MAGGAKRVSKGGPKRKGASKKLRKGDDAVNADGTLSQLENSVNDSRTQAADVVTGDRATGRPDTASNVFQVRTGAHVPGVININDTLSAGGGSGTLSRRGFYELCRESGRQGSEAQMIADLVSYVRHDLFPKWKFFMSRHQLVFSTIPDSICFQICKGMGVYDSFALKWWDEYQEKILETLNSKRADVTACIKRTFLSK